MHECLTLVRRRRYEKTAIFSWCPRPDQHAVRDLSGDMLQLDDIVVSLEVSRNQIAHAIHKDKIGRNGIGKGHAVTRVPECAGHGIKMPQVIDRDQAEYGTLNISREAIRIRPGSLVILINFGYSTASSCTQGPLKK